jgi:hypothetical protein
VNKYYGEHFTYEADADDGLVTDWNHMWWAANVLLAEATDQGTFHQTTQVRNLMDAGVADAQLYACGIFHPQNGASSWCRQAGSAYEHAQQPAAAQRGPQPLATPT